MDFAQTWYLTAYNQLSRSRDAGMGGPQSLSIGEMKSYLELKGVEDPEERGRFVRYMQTMDQVYLEHHMPEDDE